MYTCIYSFFFLRLFSHIGHYRVSSFVFWRLSLLLCSDFFFLIFYLPERFLFSYVFLLPVGSLSFQLNEVPLSFLIGSVYWLWTPLTGKFFSFLWFRMITFWDRVFLVGSFLLLLLFFSFQHLEYIMLLSFVLESFCWKFCW